MTSSDSAFFLPLGMNATNLSNAASGLAGNYAFPHSRVDGKLQVVEFGNLDNAAPAGAINSSTADMAQWVIVQLGRGRLPIATGGCSAKSSRARCGPRRRFFPPAIPLLRCWR